MNEKKSVGVKAYFNSKSQLAIEEINDDCVSIALVFQRTDAGEENERGVLMATKVKADIDKFIPLTPHLARRSTPPFILMGSGDYGDFEEVGDYANQYVADVYNFYEDEEAVSLKPLRVYICKVIRNAYINRKKAYGVDLLIVSVAHGGPEIIRIKYNGEYHPCANYAVAGGFRTISESVETGTQNTIGKGISVRKKTLGKETSIRKKALEILKGFYDGGKIPNLEEAKSLARDALALEEDKGEVLFGEI